MRLRARLAVAIGLGLATSSFSQPVRKTFEAASIRVCRGGGIKCSALRQLIAEAYVGYANGVSSDPREVITEVERGPGWLDTDRYQIITKAADGVPYAETRGPMMQALLEDRFKLRLRREMRESSVYLLTVAKGGSLLVPLKEGSCVVVDPHVPPAAVPGEPPVRGCGSGLLGADGMNLRGATIADLCVQLSLRMDRPVIDQTGIQGMFDIHLALSPDQMIPTRLKALMGGGVEPTDPTGTPIFDSVRKLGLKLESGKAPVEVLVIENIERPSEN